MEKHVLIIEDDPEIAGLVEMHLRDLGFHARRAEDGPAGLRMGLGDAYDLVILDLMLPGMDGLEVCRALREKRKGLPILMLTARSEEMDKVLGLELGADDYLTKPFNIRELIARVKAIIRRTEAVKQEAVEAGQPAELTYAQLAIQLEKRRVTVDGRTVELTAKEFDLLALFATHPGTPYTREQLLNQVWGYSFTGYEHTVNSHINRLRSKIEADPSRPRYIITVWGYGYRFAEREELHG